MTYFRAAAFIISVVSTIYQRNQAAKAKAAAKKAANDAAGFQLAAEGEIVNVPIVYGRAKIAGARVYHAVSKDYVFAGPSLGGITFLSGGDPREISALPLSETITNQQIIASNSPNTFIQRINLTSENSIIYRTSANSNYTIQCPTGQSQYLFAGVKVTVLHFPMNRTYWLEQAADLQPTNVIYTVISYDSNGLLTLSGPQTSPDVIHAVRPSMSFSRDDNDKSFLFIQQVLSAKGLNNVLAAEIDDRDWRDAVFTEDSNDARLYVYPDGDVVCNMAVNNYPERSTAKFPEVAYASLMFKIDRKNPTYSGIPNVAFFVEGKRVNFIIPSGNSYIVSGYGYSNNPAYVLLDYLHDFKYGKGLPYSKIDLESFYKAAKLCDIIVETSKPLGGTYWQEKVLATPGTVRQIRRYECNTILDTKEDIRENITKILNTMDGADLIWSDGLYKLRLTYPYVWKPSGVYSIGDIVQYPGDNSSNVDLYRSLVNNNKNILPITSLGSSWEKGPDGYLTAAYINDDDILLDSEISQSWPSLTEKLNHCTVRFLNETNNFDEDVASWPPKYINNTVYQTYLAEDNGQLLEDEEFIDGITTSYHALAKAEAKVRSSRNSLVYKLVLTRKFADLEPGDIINVSSSILQLTSELLSIMNIETNSEGNIEITAYRFDARSLAWNAKDDEVISQRSPYEFYSLQASNITYYDTAAVEKLSSGYITWIKAQDSRVLKYNIYYAGGPESIQDVFTEWTFLGSSGTDRFTLPVLAAGTYTVTVVSVLSNNQEVAKYDMLTGYTWPLKTIEIGEFSVGRSSALVYIYRVSPQDLSGWIPAPSTYNFDNFEIINLPESWYRTAQDAYLMVPLGDLYHTSAEAHLNGTAVEAPLVWEAALLANPITNEKPLSAYYRRAPTGDYPNTPTGGSWTFPDGPYILPTGNVVWAQDPPPGTGALYGTYSVATRNSLYGPMIGTLGWTPPAEVGGIGEDGDSGLQMATVELYKWATVQPTLPNTFNFYTSNYTWATGIHNNISTSLTNLGWDKNVPSKVTSPGIKLWILKRNLIVSADTPMSVIDWNVDSQYFLSTGDDILGLQKTTVKAFYWGTTSQNIAGTSTYNWVNGALNSTNGFVDGVSPPNFWKVTNEGGFAGLTLWEASQVILENSSATTTQVDWTDNTNVHPIGYYGLDGVGITHWTWIKYAPNGDPTSGEISDYPAGMTHMGIAYNKETDEESLIPSDYTWSLIIGEGVEGPPGPDGITHWTWIKYAPNGNPTAGEMSQDPTGMDYIGIAENQLTQLEGNDPSVYTWSLFRGEPGTRGIDGVSLEYIGEFYTPPLNPENGQWYRNLSVVPHENYVWYDGWFQMSVDGTDGQQGPAGAAAMIFLGNYVNAAACIAANGGTPEINWVYRDTTNNAVYIYTYDNGIYSWELMVLDGSDGDQGIPQYMWIQYAPNDNPTSGQMSNNPVGMQYIGIAYNQATAQEGTDPSVYSWSLLGGANGIDSFLWIRYSVNSNGNPMVASPSSLTKYIGIVKDTTLPTAPTSYTAYTWSKYMGDDGVSTYTWIKYAITPTSGINNLPTADTKYIGIAYNKSTPDETNTYSDYTWSLYVGAPGDTGIQGPPGPNGETTYTWIRYSNSANGNPMSDSPTGMKYIGISPNQLDPNENTTNYTLYQWSLIQGPAGVGSLKAWAFIRQNATPSTPLGGSYLSPTPTSTGWSDGAPSTPTDQILWASTRIFTSTGVAPQQSSWTPPVKLTNTSSVSYLYSALTTNPGTPPNANWVSTLPANNVWVAQRIYTNGVWGSYNYWKTLGETGDTGLSVSITYNDAPASGATPSKPTNVAGTTYWGVYQWHTNATSASNWMSQKVDNGTTANWGDAIKIKGLDGAVGQKGDPGEPGPGGLSTKPWYRIRTNLAPTGGDIFSGPTTIDGAPSTGWWGVNWLGSWSTSAPNPAEGQYIFQTNGTFDPNTLMMFWSFPRLLTFRVGSLDALSARLGTISSGNVTLDSSSYIRSKELSGETPVGWKAGKGYWMGYDGTQYKFSIGDYINNGHSMDWNGSVLRIGGGALSGSLTIDQNGYINSEGKELVSGQINNTPGFWMGRDPSNGIYKFKVGDGTRYIAWDGSTFYIGGDLVATGNVKLHGITHSTFTSGVGSFVYNNYQYVSFDGPNFDLAGMDSVVINVHFQVYQWESPVLELYLYFGNLGSEFQAQNLIQRVGTQDAGSLDMLYSYKWNPPVSVDNHTYGHCYILARSQGNYRIDNWTITMTGYKR